MYDYFCLTKRYSSIDFDIFKNHYKTGQNMTEIKPCSFFV